MKNLDHQNKEYEFVHVMLKPDALDAGIREVILKDLAVSGGDIVLEKKMNLTLDQILSIYRNFEDVNAKPAVLAFYMVKLTEHFIFRGSQGLHEKILDIKGSKTKATGIRGRYVSRKSMTADELLKDVKGVLPGSAEAVRYVDFGLFGTDMLHSADDQIDSIVAIKALFSREELKDIDI